MLRQIHRLLMCLALLVAGNAWAGNDSLAPLFEKIAAAYGATPPIAMREAGNMTSFRKGTGLLLRLYQAPDRFRIVIGYDSGPEVRTMLGTLAWQQDEPASEELRGAIMLQCARIVLPWNLLAAKKTVRDLGTVVDANGKTLQSIEVPINEAMKLIADVDPETGRILRSRSIQSVGDGKALEFTTLYSNFRTEHGRQHALTEQHYIMGQLIGQSTIEMVDYPPTLPEDAFALAPEHQGI